MKYKVANAILITYITYKLYYNIFILYSICTNCVYPFLGYRYVREKNMSLFVPIYIIFLSCSVLTKSHIFNIEYMLYTRTHYHRVVSFLHIKYNSIIYYLIMFYIYIYCCSYIYYKYIPTIHV